MYLSNLYKFLLEDNMNKKYDAQEPLDRLVIERLWRGVSKTNIKDIEKLKRESQLREVLKKKGH